MLFDTHAHIYTEEFDEDFDAMVARCRETGIEHIIMPSISRKEFPRMEQALRRYPEMLSIAIGLHPAYVKEDYREELAFVRQKLSEPWIAMGEIGLDYYWSTEFKQEQIEALTTQLDWAIEYNLPVIFHVRNAFADLVAILSQDKYESVRGIIHSFTGTKDELEAVLRFPNLMIAINGVATFKNSDLRDYIGLIPHDRILIETDAPYLSPVPHRGKRNEPAFIRHTAEHIAPIWGLSIEAFAELTTSNARRLFGL